MSYALEKVGGALEGVGDAFVNVIDGIVSDPKKLVMLGVSIAFPGAAAWIGSQVGLSGVAATIAGNTVLSTISNGGNVEEAFKGALIGAVAQGVGESVKSSFLPSDSVVSGLEKTISEYAGKVASGVTVAALMGKDPVAALVFGGANAATDIIINKAFENTDIGRSFNGLPTPAKNAITAALTASLSGTDVAKATANSLFQSGIKELRAGVSLQKSAASKLMPPLTAEQIEKYTFKNNPELQEKIANEDIAGAFLSNLTKAEDVLGQEIDVGVAERIAEKLKASGEPDADYVNNLSRDAIYQIAAEQELDRLVEETGNPENLTVKDLFREISYDYYNEKAVAQGWDSLEQKEEAAKVGATTPQQYEKSLEEKTAFEEKAKEAGFNSGEEYSIARNYGFINSDEVQKSLSGINAFDIYAQRDGWNSFNEKIQAQGLGYDDPEEYQSYKDRINNKQPDVIKDLEDAGLYEVADLITSGGESDQTNTQISSEDISAQQEGWANAQEKRIAEAGYGFTDPESYRAYRANLDKPQPDVIKDLEDVGLEEVVDIPGLDRVADLITSGGEEVAGPSGITTKYVEAMPEMQPRANETAGDVIATQHDDGSITYSREIQTTLADGRVASYVIDYDPATPNREKIISYTWYTAGQGEPYLDQSGRIVYPPNTINSGWARPDFDAEVGVSTDTSLPEDAIKDLENSGLTQEDTQEDQQQQINKIIAQEAGFPDYATYEQYGGDKAVYDRVTAYELRQQEREAQRQAREAAELQKAQDAQKAQEEELLRLDREYEESLIASQNQEKAMNAGFPDYATYLKFNGDLEAYDASIAPPIDKDVDLPRAEEPTTKQPELIVIPDEEGNQIVIDQEGNVVDIIQAEQPPIESITQPEVTDQITDLVKDTEDKSVTESVVEPETKPETTEKDETVTETEAKAPEVIVIPDENGNQLVIDQDGNLVDVISPEQEPTPEDIIYEVAPEDDFITEEDLNLDIDPEADQPFEEEQITEEEEKEIVHSQKNDDGSATYIFDDGSSLTINPDGSVRDVTESTDDIVLEEQEEEAAPPGGFVGPQDEDRTKRMEDEFARYLDYLQAGEPLPPDYDVQDLGITQENWDSFNQNLLDMLEQGRLPTQWQPNEDGTLTYVDDDGSTITINEDGEIVHYTKAPEGNLPGETPPPAPAPAQGEDTEEKPFQGPMGPMTEDQINRYNDEFAKYLDFLQAGEPPPPDYGVQDLGITDENWESFNQNLKQMTDEGRLPSQWQLDEEGNYTYVADDGSTLTIGPDGEIVHYTEAPMGNLPGETPTTTPVTTTPVTTTPVTTTPVTTTPVTTTPVTTTPVTTTPVTTTPVTTTPATAPENQSSLGLMSLLSLLTAQKQPEELKPLYSPTVEYIDLEQPFEIGRAKNNQSNRTIEVSGGGYLDELLAQLERRN